MYEQKTKENDQSVTEFIESVDHPKKREDAFKLLDIFTETTGYQPKMWGSSIIGFGKYHYKYKSGHQGVAPLVGFSPWKAKISLYITLQDLNREQLLKNLGKHTTGKSCIYINKLEDIDINVLKEIIRNGVQTLQRLYPDQGEAQLDE